MTSNEEKLEEKLFEALNGEREAARHALWTIRTQADQCEEKLAMGEPVEDGDQIAEMIKAIDFLSYVVGSEDIEKVLARVRAKEINDQLFYEAEK